MWGSQLMGHTAGDGKFAQWSAMVPVPTLALPDTSAFRATQ